MRATDVAVRPVIPGDLRDVGEELEELQPVHVEVVELRSGAARCGGPGRAPPHRRRVQHDTGADVALRDRDHRSIDQQLTDRGATEQIARLEIEHASAGRRWIEHPWFGRVHGTATTRATSRERFYLVASCLGQASIKDIEAVAVERADHVGERLPLHVAKHAVGPIQSVGRPDDAHQAREQIIGTSVRLAEELAHRCVGARRCRPGRQVPRESGQETGDVHRNIQQAQRSRAGTGKEEFGRHVLEFLQQDPIESTELQAPQGARHHSVRTGACQWLTRLSGSGSDRQTPGVPVLTTHPRSNSLRDARVERGHATHRARSGDARRGQAAGGGVQGRCLDSRRRA